MPLSQGCYLKEAVGSKQIFKSMRLPNASTISTASGTVTVTATALETSKRSRKSRENSYLNNRQQNAKRLRKQSLEGRSMVNNLQLSYLLGESLARHGRLQEAFNIYTLISSEQLEGFVPLEKLHIMGAAIIDYVRGFTLNLNANKSENAGSKFEALSASNGRMSKPFNNTANSADIASLMDAIYNDTMPSRGPDWSAGLLAGKQSAGLMDAAGLLVQSAYLESLTPAKEFANIIATISSEQYDPLLCPLCSDILRCPVTTNCGHTFCRQCCDTITMCNVCNIKFLKYQRDDVAADIPNTKHYVTAIRQTSITTRHTHAIRPAYSLSSSSSSCSSSSNSSMLITQPANNKLHYSVRSSKNTIMPASTAPALEPTLLEPSSPPQPPPASVHSTPASKTSPTRNSMHSPAAVQHLELLTNTSNNLLTPAPYFTTVTTSTVASTTDTATTTMAATTAIIGQIPTPANAGNDNIKFMPDVLVRRLVEKWWGADLQAQKINEKATSYMHLNMLDDALKFCNASLEKSPTNLKSLLLRAEVLMKMNHYQSSLADADNALKSCYTSAKAHYMRALALNNLGRYEEALYETCLAISLDNHLYLSNTELFQHDLTKILQKLLLQASKCAKMDLLRTWHQRGVGNTTFKQTLRPNQMSILNDDNKNNKSEMLKSFEEEDFLSASYAKECDVVMADDEDVLACSDLLNCAEKRSIYASIAKKYELELRQQAAHQHNKRKCLSMEIALLASTNTNTTAMGCNDCYNNQFLNILERTQQEIIRLKRIDSLSDGSYRKLTSVPPSVIDPSDFDCVLCCRTFWKPVVTPCGHTYCLVCLDRCMDYSALCPLCMSPLVEPNVNRPQDSTSPVPLILTKRPVTKFLEAAMKRFIPDSYAKRFRQEMVMEPSVPIFICTTAFPYVPCPLFVYEPRYRLMVRRAIESGDKQFGIVQPYNGKSRYYDYGTILDIRDCVLLGDGCSILSTIGCKRFKIMARHEKDGYETAKVEYIYDDSITDESLPYLSNMHGMVLAKAIEWYESLSNELKHEILQSYGEMPAVEPNWETITNGPAWAWWIIALLPLRPQLKVDILATTSLEKRLRAIEKTISSMPGNYRYQRMVENCNVTVVVPSRQHQVYHMQQSQNLNLSTDDRLPGHTEPHLNQHTPIQHQQHQQQQQEQHELLAHHQQCVHPVDAPDVVATDSECCQHSAISLDISDRHPSNTADHQHINSGS